MLTLRKNSVQNLNSSLKEHIFSLQRNLSGFWRTVFLRTWDGILLNLGGDIAYCLFHHGNILSVSFYWLRLLMNRLPNSLDRRLSDNFQLCDRLNLSFSLKPSLSYHRVISLQISWNFIHNLQMSNFHTLIFFSTFLHFLDLSLKLSCWVLLYQISTWNPVEIFIFIGLFKSYKSLIF